MGLDVSPVCFKKLTFLSSLGDHTVVISDRRDMGAYEQCGLTSFIISFHFVSHSVRGVPFGYLSFILWLVIL